MSDRIRILLVDDSYFMRKIISEMIGSAPDMEIIGEAGNGLEAVKMAKELEPGVITMDYNMPFMNGAEASEEILKSIERPPAILMLSARTVQGAAETLECLKAGAVDFLAKPSGELSIDMELVKKELLDKIRLASTAHIQRRSSYHKAGTSKKQKNINLKSTAGIIVIGSSTGGPPTLENVLTPIKHTLKTPILIIQHMPEKFTKSLAERLDKIISIKTKEAEDGEILKDNICLIAPGGWHTVIETKQTNEIKQMMVHLNREPPIFGLRPSIDTAFSSVADHFGEQAIGIILTGMGSDGTKGAEAIKSKGGHIIAQSPESAVISSMPNSVIKAGLADEILVPDEIAERIIELGS
jgi:two-component system, chemotaxis family, protein-glutamate methylesterase/glutaminase